LTFSDFFDSLGDLDWLALIVAGLAVFAFAWAWYGPLLGSQWRAATGREMSQPDPMTMGKGYLKFFLFGIGIAYFIPALHAFFINGMTLASRVVWEGGSWMLWGIDFGFWFLAAVISAEVQDLMA
jgi:hypothetical protein